MNINFFKKAENISESKGTQTAWSLFLFPPQTNDQVKTINKNQKLLFVFLTTQVKCNRLQSVQIGRKKRLHSSL